MWRERGHVTQPPRGGQRGLLAGHRSPPLRAQVEERAQRPGICQAWVSTAGPGVVDQGQQHRDLGVEPGHGLLLGRELGGHHTGQRAVETQRRPVRAEPCGGRHGGVQVVVQHAMGGRLPVRIGVAAFGGFGRVGAQQAVEFEPAGQVLGGHVGPGELTQRGARLGPRDPGQAGRRGQRDVRARVQAEQPEHPGRGRAELVIGPGQDGSQVGRRVIGLEGVEPAARVPQLGGQLGQRALRPPGGPASGDGQRQREARARRDNLPAAAGSAATTVPARLRASMSRASASLSTSRVTGTAPSAATRPLSWLRLVTTTREPGEPGSSGRTWAAPVALSSTIRTRSPATRLRNRAARSRRAP